MKKYKQQSAEMRAQIVQALAVQRDNRTIGDVSDAYGVNLSMVKGWLKTSKKQALSAAAGELGHYLPAKRRAWAVLVPVCGLGFVQSQRGRLTSVCRRIGGACQQPGDRLCRTGVDCT